LNHSNLEAASSLTQWSRSLRLFSTIYTLGLLTLAAAILRFIFLSSKSFWLDEGFTAALAVEPFIQPIREMLHGQAAVYMTLYFAIMHCWSLVGGSSEISMRLPSVIFATATVPLIYVLGAELVDRRVGLTAAILLSVNVSCIEYGQEARAYAMVGMLATLSSLLFVRCIKRGSREGYRGYFLAALLCSYAHLFGILVLLAQGLSLFLFRTDRETRNRLMACVIVAAILSVPPIVLSIIGDFGGMVWVPLTTVQAIIRVFAAFAGACWGNPTGAPSRILFSIYLAIIGVAVVGASERERPVIGFLLLSVLVPVAIDLLVSIFKPLFVTRYLLIGLPFFVLLAAIGLMRIKPRAVMVLIAVSIITMSLSQDRDFYDSPPKEDWRGAINFVATHSERGDLLLIFPDWERAPVDYYSSRHTRPVYFRVIADRLKTLNATADASGGKAGTLRSFLAARGVNSYARVWVLTNLYRKGEPALSELEMGHQVVAVPDLSGLFLARID